MMNFEGLEGRGRDLCRRCYRRTTFICPTWM